MTSNPSPLPGSGPGDDIVAPPDGAPAAPAGDPAARSKPAGPVSSGDAMQAEPVYHAVEDWVIDQFLPAFRRTLGGEFRWCAQWWKHDEAVSRLIALWHAWEVLRLQPGTGLGVWYRDHLDHQLPILMGARGPFYQCSETAHREPRETVVEVAPGDVWDEDSGIQGGLTRSIASTRTGEDRG